MILRPRKSSRIKTLFPYTTLSRSHAGRPGRAHGETGEGGGGRVEGLPRQADLFHDRPPYRFKPGAWLASGKGRQHAVALAFARCRQGHQMIGPRAGQAGPGDRPPAYFRLPLPSAGRAGPAARNTWWT